MMTYIALEEIKKAEKRRAGHTTQQMSCHARLQDGFMLYAAYMQRQQQQNVQGDAREEREFTAPLRDPG